MSTVKQTILIEYAGRVRDEDFDSDNETFDVSLSKEVGAKEISRTLTFDDKELVITGVPDVVRQLERWILAAWRQPDYNEILKPLFHATKPHEPAFFPLASDVGWHITVKG
jgi:hypothetical protein